MTRSFSVASFTPAGSRQVQRGLLGWATGRYGGLVVERIEVRRTLAGRLACSFPTRRDARGRKVAIVRPASRAAHHDLTRQIVAELCRRGSVRP